MQHSFDVEIAKKIGMKEAIIFNYIYFWIEKNRVNNVHFYENTYWTFNSNKAFSDLFPYMTSKQIRTTLENLRKNGLIRVGNFNKIKIDRTLWYSITEKGYSLFQKGNCVLPNRAIGYDCEGEAIPVINPVIYTDINIKEKYNKKKSEVFEIIAYLNEMAKTKYKPTTKATARVINARLNEGFKVEDFKRVIDNKCNDWIGTKYQTYLRPETLFGNKFESYLNQKTKEESLEEYYEREGIIRI